jgi:26S proteasome regulatory subunit N1
LHDPNPIPNSPFAIMAQDSDVPKAADKGKGKAVESEKVDDAKKGKDGQPAGKKDDDKIIDGEAH